MKQAFRHAFTLSLPVMAGYLSLGIAYGILMEDYGYNFIWSGLVSLFVYGGSIQFVALNFLKGGFSLLTIAIMTLLVNSRHIFYGLSLFNAYRPMGKKKPYMIYALSDETFSLLCSYKDQPGLDNNACMFFICLIDHFWWTLGGVLGGLVGSLITFDTTGLDFAMTALFVVIFTEQWLEAKTHIPAIVGILSAIVCLNVFGSDNFLLPTLIVAVCILFLAKTPISVKLREEEGK